jgi:hypothetical protein
MLKYMFDTNIFNDLLDGRVDLIPYIGKAMFFATHIQLDELNNTPDVTRRERLSHLFEEITSNSVPTESFILGFSRLDQAKLGGENVINTESSVYGDSKYGKAKYTINDNLYGSIKRELDKEKKKINNIQDALIAETAIKNNLTLITHDSLLFNVITKHGGACANIFQVIMELESN